MKMFTLSLVLVISTLFPVFGNEKEENMVNENAPFIAFEDMTQVMNLAKEKPTVLFFKADWCPSCTSAATHFKKNSDKLEDVNLVVVNYDISGDLKVKYGVTYQHTFVQISPTGESLVKWNGGATDSLLKKIIKEDM